MKAYIALLFFSVLILTTSAEYTEEDGVVVLTDANFDEAIK